MADNAFEFAAKNNLLRQNQVHGEQEAKLLLEEGFSLDFVQEEIVEQHQHMEVEESWHETIGSQVLRRNMLDKQSLKNRFLVNKNFNENSWPTQDTDGSFLDNGLPSSSRELLQQADDDDLATTPADQAAANSGSFKCLGALYVDYTWVEGKAHV